MKSVNMDIVAMVVEVAGYALVSYNVGFGAALGIYLVIISKKLSFRSY